MEPQICLFPGGQGVRMSPDMQAGWKMLFGYREKGDALLPELAHSGITCPHGISVHQKWQRKHGKWGAEPEVCVVTGVTFIHSWSLLPTSDNFQFAPVSAGLISSWSTSAKQAHKSIRLTRVSLGERRQAFVNMSVLVYLKMTMQ